MSAPRSGRRVRTRLVLVFVLTAIVVTAITAGVLTRIVSTSFESEYERSLQRSLATADLILERRGTAVSAALSRLQVLLEGPELARLQRLLGGGPAVVGEAEHLGALVGLERLTLLDEEGTVLSSLEWPERAGLVDGRVVASEPGRITLEPIDDDGRERLAVVVSRRVEAGRRGLTLVGGMTLGQEFLDDVAAGGPAWLFVGGRSSVPSLSSGEVAYDPPHEDWSLARRELRDPSGERVGALVLAVSRRGLSDLQSQLRTDFLLLGAASAILAGGVALWIGGRISRPVGRLVRAVDEIAAGHADYTFPRRAEDELQAVEEAFSRLQRSLEAQRHRSAAAERVAAWREVARHVAHEVKNPLAPIRLTVENLIRAKGKDPRLFDELFEEGSRTILEEVEQLSRLVSEFSEFARLPTPNPSPTGLHDLVDDVLDLYGADGQIEIVRSYAPDSPTVRVDAEQMNRALKNVVGNALEAMRGHPPREERHRLEVVTRIEDDRVALEIADSGPGLPPEAVGRIFEPYFTTKQEGTGLGMAIAYRIVTEHDGWIAAENRAAGGARIRIQLPLAEAER